MSDFKDKVESGIDKAKQGADHLAHKVEEGTEKAAHKVSEAATATGNKVKEAGDQIKDAGH